MPDFDASENLDVTGIKKTEAAILSFIALQKTNQWASAKKLKEAMYFLFGNTYNKGFNITPSWVNNLLIPKRVTGTRFIKWVPNPSDPKIQLFFDAIYEHRKDCMLHIRTFSFGSQSILKMLCFCLCTDYDTIAAEMNVGVDTCDGRSEVEEESTVDKDFDDLLEQYGEGANRKRRKLNTL